MHYGSKSIVRRKIKNAKLDVFFFGAGGVPKLLFFFPHVLV